MKKVLLQSVIIGLLLVSPVFGAEQSSDVPNITNASSVNSSASTDNSEKKSIDINQLFDNLSNSTSGVSSSETKKTQDNDKSKAVGSTQNEVEPSADNLSDQESDSENNESLKGYLEYDPAQDSANTESNSGSDITNEDTPMPFYIEEAQQLEASENAVGLNDFDFKKKNINIMAPPKFATKSLVSDRDKKKVCAGDNSIILDSASKFSDPEYWIGPVYTSYTATSGRFSFGTSYYSGLDSASLSSSTGVFTRYDGKRFAISTSFSKSAQYNDDSYSNTFSVAPEFKITKRLSLLDIIQTNMEQTSRTNKIVLRYTPKLKNHEDDVQLEFGAAQSFSENQYVESSISFSTRFKL